MKINNIVWASSETVLGLPFDTYPPYVPVDEEYDPRPESSYSLSKVMGEEMARQYCRRNPEMKIFGLRYSNIMEEHDYKQFKSFQNDPFLRKWNFWGYIDARDVAQACLLAMESNLKGADNFIIAADDTVMTLVNDENVKNEITRFGLHNDSVAGTVLFAHGPTFMWGTIIGASILAIAFVLMAVNSFFKSKPEVTISSETNSDESSTDEDKNETSN